MAKACLGKINTDRFYIGFPEDCQLIRAAARECSGFLSEKISNWHDPRDSRNRRKQSGFQNFNYFGERLMKLSQTIVAAIVVVLGSTGLSQAQSVRPMAVVPMPGGGVHRLGMHHGGFHHRVSHPVYITPERFNGYTPWGGINTRNQQVNNTYFDYGRNGSQYNGSRRWVSRPVYDSYGQVTGYQQGHVWNNSLTGQEHGNVTTVTPNGHGGQIETATAYSTAGGNITPRSGGN